MSQRSVYTGIATWLALCAAATAQAPKPKFAVLARIGDSYAGLVQGLTGNCIQPRPGETAPPARSSRLPPAVNRRRSMRSPARPRRGCCWQGMATFTGPPSKGGAHGR
jgi:hypothetical protein